MVQEGDYKGALANFIELSTYQNSSHQIVGYKDSIQQRNAMWEKCTKHNTLAACSNRTAALKTDGTVLYTYAQQEVNDWQGITSVSVGSHHAVGLKFNGTVVAAGKNEENQCDVQNWRNITAIAAGSEHTLALRADGTVVATGKNKYFQCKVSDWTDIIAITAGDAHSVGLKSDGTVIAAGQNDYGQCNVSEWTDIVAIAAGKYHTVGLKSDGTVIATKFTGNSEEYRGQCDVGGWTNIKLPN